MVYIYLIHEKHQKAYHGYGIFLSFTMFFHMISNCIRYICNAISNVIIVILQFKIGLLTK